MHYLSFRRVLFLHVSDSHDATRYLGISSAAAAGSDRFIWTISKSTAGFSSVKCTTVWIQEKGFVLLDWEISSCTNSGFGNWNAAGLRNMLQVLRKIFAPLIKRQLDVTRSNSGCESVQKHSLKCRDSLNWIIIAQPCRMYNTYWSYLNSIQGFYPWSFCVSVSTDSMVHHWCAADECEADFPCTQLGD